MYDDYKQEDKQQDEQIVKNRLKSELENQVNQTNNNHRAKKKTVGKSHSPLVDGEVSV